MMNLKVDVGNNNNKNFNRDFVWNFEKCFSSSLSIRYQRDGSERISSRDVNLEFKSRSKEELQTMRSSSNLERLEPR